MEGGRPPEPDDQGTGDEDLPAGDPHPPRRGDQRQHHASFRQEAYALVAEAYLSALEERSVEGMAVDRVASVASFFVSRIDTLVDRGSTRSARAAAPTDRARLEALKGKVAIANAKLAYRHLPDFSLARAGARSPGRRRAAAAALGLDLDQEPGLPRRALRRRADRPRHGQHDAARDHGRLPRPRRGSRDAREGPTEARKQLAELAALGISLDAATDELLADGVAKFVEPFRKLLEAIAAKTAELAAHSGSDVAR